MNTAKCSSLSEVLKALDGKKVTSVDTSTNVITFEDGTTCTVSNEMNGEHYVYLDITRIKPGWTFSAAHPVTVNIDESGEVTEAVVISWHTVMILHKTQNLPGDVSVWLTFSELPVHA